MTKNSINVTGGDLTIIADDYHGITYENQTHR